MKKKTVRKLTLAKETVRGLDQRDDLGRVAGGVYYQDQGMTVVSGCTDCDPSEGSCCSCINSC